MTDRSFDVIVIGGGAGGVAAAVRAAQLGARVAVVEDRWLGGLCMNRGCVPFGHMMAAARIIGQQSLAREMGISWRGLDKDLGRLMKRQTELVTFMRQGVEGLLQKRKVAVVKGRGRLAGSGRVETGTGALSSGKIILATGSEWVKPGFPGGDLPGVVTTDDLLGMESVPERCLLVGDSAMLIEIAQFLRRYGARVWMAFKENPLLRSESKVIRTRLTKVLQADGITLLDRAEVRSLKRKSGRLQATLQVKDAEQSLVADMVVTLRRKASLSGLGLETVGLDEKGDYLPVNERMETGVEGLYAIGDLTAPEERHYSHLASAGGIVAAENAMGMRSSFDPRFASRVLFSQPQAASVGLSLKAAKEAGYDAVSGSAPLSMNPKGMILEQTAGIVEVVAEKRYGEILGVHVIGEGADEMIGAGILAIQLEATLEDLANTPFPHPTLSESIAEAAREALGRPIYLP